MKVKENGYTLVEVVIVIAIISIVLSLTSISFKGLTRKAQFKKDVLELKSDILYVRSQSIATGNRYRISFYPDNDYYSIYEIDKRVKTIKRKYFKSATNLVAINFPEGNLSFSSIGAPNRGGTITLDDNSSQMCHIKVMVATGRVEVQWIK